MVEVAGLFDGVLDDLLGARGLGQLAHRDHLWPGLDELLDLEAHLAQINIEIAQDVGPDAGAFLDEAEQDVLGPDVFVVEALGLLVGEGHDLASPICKAFEHGRVLSQTVLCAACRGDPSSLPLSLCRAGFGRTDHPTLRTLRHPTGLVVLGAVLPIQPLHLTAYVCT